MKKFFLQFIISRSLDSAAPLSAFWKKWIARSPELERFERQARTLDQRLKQRVEGRDAAVPHSLHASIMRAVRESRPEPRALGGSTAWGISPGLRWGMAAAGLLLLGAGLWLGPHDWALPGGRAARSSNLASLPAVGPLTEQLTSNGLAVITLPLTRQMEDLSRNMQETAQFLLASLP
jgi:hypothetical protein